MQSLDMANSRKAVRGWVLYDLANVIFGVGVVGLYFPLWIVDDLGGKDRHVAIASAVSMLVIFLMSPRYGAYADRTGRRVRSLMISTIICCTLTLFIGIGGIYPSIAIFIAASIAFGSGLLFYDTLLPIVSSPENRGRISGYGIGAGFGGAIIGVITGIMILAIDSGAKPIVFAVLGTFFFLASIPCFLWVKDVPPTQAIDVKARRTPRKVLAHCLTVPGMSRFLLGRLLYTDSTNTFFAFMSIFAVKELHFSTLQTQIIFLVGILVGPVGALGSGKMADLIGPKVTLDRVLVLWMTILAACAFIPLSGLPSWMFWLVAPLAGLAFGSTSTVDRALLIEMAPPGETSTFFGYFNMVGRFSSLLGPLLWALIADWLGFGRPIAILALLGMTFTAWWLFRGLPSWLSDRSLAGELAAETIMPQPTA